MKRSAEVDLVGHRRQRWQALQVLQAIPSWSGRQLGTFEIGQIGFAGDLVDGDADQALDEGAAAGDEPAKAVAGEQVLPGVIELPPRDPQHGAGRQGLANSRLFCTLGRGRRSGRLVPCRCGRDERVVSSPGVRTPRSTTASGFSLAFSQPAMCG